MAVKKRIIFIIALALIIGAVFVPSGKVMAAPDKSVWYCIQTESKFTDPGIKVYVESRFGNAGYISSDGKRAIDYQDLQSDGYEDIIESGVVAYYQLPSGYCVASGVAIHLKQEAPIAGVPTNNLYYYSHVKGNLTETYEEIEFTNDWATVTPTSDTTYGCTYRVTDVSIEEYKSPTLDYFNNEIMGTKVEKDYFKIVATLASGSSVTLDKTEFNIEIEGNSAGDLVIPKSKVKDTDTASFVATYVVTGRKTRAYTQSVTNKKLKEITAEWDGTTYHVGDTIKNSSIKATAVYYDVVLEKDITEKIATNNTNFSFTPAVIKQAGENVIVVNYLDKETTCKITGYGIESLDVTYPDKEIVVGGNVETSKIKVYAKFSNGDTVQIKEGWTIQNTLVANSGENTFLITYNYGYGAVTAELKIKGVERAISKITAKYKGEKLPVGATIQINDIEVIAVYNDKTEEQVYGFLLSQATVTKVGSNVITITYLSHTATVSIVGTEKMPSTITAIYNGNTVIAGNDIEVNNITVTAYFNDGTFENVTDFSLSAKTLTGIGVNTVTVTYKDATATIYVVVIAKEAVKIESQYKGGPVVAGNNFSRDNLIVTATFNDNTTEQVTDFVLTTTLVEKIGQNVFTVTYGTVEDTFTVTGLPKIITGEGELKADIGNEDFDGVTLTAFINDQLVAENIALEVEAFETNELKKLVQKTSAKGKFIGFSMDIDGYQFTDNQYLTARVTIPADFDPSRVAVFYTPNRKSVMARLGGGLVSFNEYEFYAYKSGTYVIVECEEDMLEKADFRNNYKPEAFLIVKNVKSEIKVGEKLNLEAAIMYGTEEQTKAGVSYFVDDTSVAKVTNNGVVLGKSAGSVELTVKTPDGKLKAVYTIDVVDED
jgi:hypothetical protein